MEHMGKSQPMFIWPGRERVASQDLRNRMVYQQWGIPNFQTDPRMYIYIYYHNVASYVCVYIYIQKYLSNACSLHLYHMLMVKSLQLFMF